jgi:hypothetical protein
MPDPFQRNQYDDETGVSFAWWMVPGGLMLAVLMAVASIALERQGLWPEWLDYDRGIGFVDERTGAKIPLLRERYTGMCGRFPNELIRSEAKQAAYHRATSRGASSSARPRLAAAAQRR